MEIRLIRYSTENGEHEGLYFTEDTEISNEEIIPFGCSLDSDLTIQVDKWELGFPFNYHLTRQ